MFRIIFLLSLVVTFYVQAEELSPLDKKNLDCFTAFWNYNEHGIGTTEEAFQICLEAAKAGGVGAQNLVVEGYLGAGQKDKALYWFKQAAQHGHEGARYFLIDYYATVHAI